MKKFIAMLLALAMSAGLVSAQVSAEPFEDDDDEDNDVTVCEGCGDPGCTLGRPHYFPGDVTGDGEIKISDAVDIFMYIANMKSSRILQGGPDSPAWRAACITGDEPTIRDAHEIFCYVGDFPGILSGDEPIVANITTLRVETDERDGIINYYTTSDLPADKRYDFDFMVEPGIFVGTSKVNAFSIGLGNLTKVSLYTKDASMPAGTLILTSKFDTEDFGTPLISGDAIESVTEVIHYGDVNCDKRINTADAVEIFKYLAKMDSVIKNPGSLQWKAACITGGDKPAVKDAVQIFMYLAGMSASMIPLD